MASDGEDEIAKLQEASNVWEAKHEVRQTCESEALQKLKRHLGASCS